MAYTPSGNVSFNVNLSAAVATGTAVLTTYNIPISASPVQNASYSSAGGSGALQCNRAIQMSGSITSGASVTTIASLSTTGATVDVGGSTAVWSHVREIVIFNDGVTGFTTGDTSAGVLNWDFSTTVANAWGVSTTSGGAAPIFSALATAPVIQIAAGSFQRFAKPFGSTGFNVGATNSYTINLGPASGNAGSINYRIIIMGD